MDVFVCRLQFKQQLHYCARCSAVQLPNELLVWPNLKILLC
jgi:hypothetical protein